MEERPAQSSLEIDELVAQGGLSEVEVHTGPRDGPVFMNRGDEPEVPCLENHAMNLLHDNVANKALASYQTEGDNWPMTSRSVLLILMSASIGVGHPPRVADPVPCPASPDADIAGICQTALDFEEGWYEGDADRMARALHPNFLMRHIGANPDNGSSVLDQSMSAQDLIDWTRAGRGKVPPDRRRHDITVFDVFQNAASAKIIAWYGVDYLQLGKWNGRWVIVNVLWGKNPAP
jgi:hypothetical protein